MKFLRELEGLTVRETAAVLQLSFFSYLAAFLAYVPLIAGALVASVLFPRNARAYLGGLPRPTRLAISIARVLS